MTNIFDRSPRGKSEKIYKTDGKQRTILRASPTAQLFPPLSGFRGGMVLVPCSPKMSTAKAIIQYAVELGRPELWMCTFAPSLVQLEEIARVTVPGRCIVNRIQLHRDPRLVEFIRTSMGGGVDKVHSKVAVLVGESGSVALIGSGNISKSAEKEVMIASQERPVVEWARDYVLSLETEV